MDGFLDTSVIIDIYRGYDPAAQWIRKNRDLKLGITAIAWMEVKVINIELFNYYPGFR
jgi:predicted nucleic acid-binding protein